MSDGAFDETVASRYDRDVDAAVDRDEAERAIVVLAELAGDGRALEFAIGTGRVAIPLADRGVETDGIELSRAMVEVMSAKQGAERIPVTIGDMATTRVDGTFSLVYLVFNTITNLLTQAEQVACFDNAAAHLEPGGHFVVETFVPQLRRLPPGERYVPFDVGPGHIGIDEYDVVEQRLTSHHVWTAHGTRFQSHHRYGWPAEYDLMARLAGLDLVDRWADWARRPFTNSSTAHVSVWRKPG